MLSGQGRRIRIALLQKDITLAAVAARLGVNRAHVSHVIAGRSRSARIENHIAQVLGTSRFTLFGPHQRQYWKPEKANDAHRVA